MFLSVLANLYHGLRLPDVLDKMKELGVRSVEMDAGGYPGQASV